MHMEDRAPAVRVRAFLLPKGMNMMRNRLCQCIWIGSGFAGEMLLFYRWIQAGLFHRSLGLPSDQLTGLSGRLL